MMITIQAGKRALGICLLLLMVTGCSREQQDWRAAEAADSVKSYGQFITRHPESELTTQARTRVAQLGEESDWQRAGSADTPEAYREFLGQHPSGKKSQEARIRIDNFALGAGRVAGSAGNAPPASDVATTGRAAGSGATSRGGGGSVGAGAGGSAAAGADGLAGAGASGAGAVGQFGVQLGAFSSAAGADSQWQVLAGEFAPELQGLSERTVPADLASGRIYRLQALVGDEARARAICEALKRRSQGCVLVLPH